MNPDKLWKLILEDLQLSVSAASFTSWLTQLEPISLDPNTSPIELTLACPSSFHKSIIYKRYAKMIQDSGSRILETDLNLQLVIHANRERTTTSSGPLFEHFQQQQSAFDLALERTGLRNEFTFDNFAVSSSNEMAHAAAQAVADHFGKAYNPLFLYGGVGVGKTHLSQAVAIETLKRNPQRKIIFCMSEEFTNGIIEAIQQKKTPEFRRRYRDVSGLFIDDIQFIAGKTTVQEEFFHTFNAILKSGGQVVMTSDRPPSDIRDLEARLRSRFEAGLLVDIGQPDFELRAAITLIKATQRGLHITTRDAQTIAANIESARQIEGFMTKLLSESTLHKREIDSTLIEALLGQATPRNEQAPPPLRPLEIVRGVAQHYNISTKDIQGKRRKKQFVTPRHLAMYILRVDYHLPFTEIAGIFSNRDHTTIMHAVDKVTHQLKDIESLRLDLTEVRKELYTL